MHSHRHTARRRDNRHKMGVSLEQKAVHRLSGGSKYESGHSRHAVDCKIGKGMRVWCKEQKYLFSWMKSCPNAINALLICNMAVRLFEHCTFSAKILFCFTLKTQSLFSFWRTASTDNYGHVEGARASRAHLRQSTVGSRRGVRVVPQWLGAFRRRICKCILHEYFFRKVETKCTERDEKSSDCEYDHFPSIPARIRRRNVHWE